MSESLQTVLLLDTNISSLPIYNHLIKGGYKVYVTGLNPHDYLAKISDKYVELDYANVSEVRELIQRLSIKFLVPGCNDLSYKVCAEINGENQFYGIDSSENTDLINEKQQFRTLAKAIGMPVPFVFSNDSFDGSGTVIVKPVDAYSGRGVTVVQKNKETQFADAIVHAVSFSRSKKYIVEEFIEGQLYSHSAFISDGKILVDFIVEEYGSSSSFAVDTSRVVSDFDAETLEKIRSHIFNLISHLQLPDGLIHTQFIKRRKDFWFIEITRRCPGDLYSQLIELSTGFPYAAAYTQPFLNEKVDSQYLPKENHVLRHTVSLQHAQTYTALRFKFPVQVLAYYGLSKSGDFVKESPFDRIGLLFLEADNHKSLDDLFKKMAKRDIYIVE